MNRQLDAALVFFALTIFCSLAFAGQRDNAEVALDKSIEITLDDDADQATRDYYDDLANKEATKLLVYLGATALLGITTLTLGFRGSQQYFRDKKRNKYEIEERRHQELLAATRQTQTQTHQTPTTPAKASILYTNPKPKASTADEILSEAQRLYKAGDTNGAMFLLEMSDDPRAKRALARLQGMKK